MKELISRIANAMGIKGKYHWYEVKYAYRNRITKEVMFHWYTQIGVSTQDTVLNSRKLKKIPNPLHFNKEVKRLLDNGTLQVEIQCYLGWFPKLK